FDAGQDDAGAPRILETHHRPGDAFDRPVILPYDVIQILDLADLDRRFPFSIDTLDGGQIGAAFVHGDRLGHAVLADGFLEVATRRGLVTARSQKEIDGVARLVDSAVQVFPFATDLDIGFVHPPALADRPLVLAKRLFEQRHEFDHPAMHG
ncbi:MAG: hypothetical protein QOJ04_6099, partial [Caballeronia sp.]|nr:hypothetical protein [Caballeronia sp.]